MKIRVGFISGLFIIGVLFSAITASNFNINSIINILILLLIIVYTYYSFINKYNRLVSSFLL
jgi:hypothetical protein